MCHSVVAISPDTLTPPRGTKINKNRNKKKKIKKNVEGNGDVAEGTRKKAEAVLGPDEEPRPVEGKE